MKKLVAILVVLALVAGVAFADINVGGYIAVQAILAEGDSTDDSEVTVGGFHSNMARADISGRNSDGTFGGFVRLPAHEMTAWHYPWGAGAFAFAWWRPSDMFRLQLGYNPNTDFAANQITGWGWHGSDAEDLVAIGNSAHFTRASVFYNGFGEAGAVVTIIPVDALSINLGIPIISGAGEWAKEVYPRLHAQFAYEIEGVGIASVTYAGGLGFVKGEDSSTGSAILDPATIYASFFLTSIENLAVNIGFNFTMPVDASEDVWYDPAQYWGKCKISPPMAAGFGLSYDMDELSIKARFAVTFGGSFTPDGGDAVKDPMIIGFDIMPGYDLGTMNFYFNAGIHMTIPDEGDSVTGWYINPFIMKQVGWGNNFFAGLVVQSDGKENAAGDKVIEWSVPIGITFAF